MMRVVFSVLALLVSITLCSEVRAMDDSAKSDSLLNVLALTYANNPQLRSARAELAAVHERLPQAQAGWLPTVSADAAVEGSDLDTRLGDGTSGGGSTTSKSVGVSLSQPLYRGGRTVAGTEVAENIVRAQVARVLSTEQDVLLNAVTYYMNVVRDRALLELSENNKKLIERQHEATNDRFEVGELTKTDVEQAKARLANAQAQVIKAKGALRNSEAEYEEVTGQVAGNLGFPSLALNFPTSLDEAILDAEHSNPDVVSAVNTQRAAEADIDNVYGELLPSVSLSASLSRAYDPAPGTLDRQDNAAVGLMASVPIFQAGAVRSRVRQAKHTANQRTLDILDIKRQVRQKVTKSWEDLRTAQAEIKAREAQVEAAAVAREGVSAETEFGARTVLDALDADQEFLDAQVALVSAKRDEIVAEFTLLSVLGNITPQHVGFADTAFDYDLNSDKLDKNIFNMDVDRVETK